MDDSFVVGGSDKSSLVFYKVPASSNK